MDKKSKSPQGALWGWGNEHEAAEYAKRVNAELQNEEAGGFGHSTVIAYSQRIDFPEQGLVCVQTETWVRID